MLWLKRNLILALGGLLALLMLGGGGYYLFTNHKKNSEVDADLQAKREELKQIKTATSKPFPNETNIDTARAELDKVRKITAQARTWFSPIVPPQVSPQEFRILLVNAIYELRRQAEQQGITLPGKNYAFSFEAQGKGLTFGANTFPELPQQLAEIHSLCSLIFNAQINKLVGIKRTRVSTDDETNRGAPDYHDLAIQTNTLTKCVVTPYIFEFQCFSPELARVIEDIQKSTNGFFLKSILVEPATAAVLDPNAIAAAAPAPAPLQRPGTPVKPAPVDPFGKTVLDEKQLKVVMLIEVIKCPQSTNTIPQRIASR